MNVIEPGTILVGAYNWRLVVLSVFVAILASYTALDLAGRVASTQGQARKWWLVGGACVMGIGIWSMHFIGMLAFRLPVTILYDMPTVALSLFAAIVGSLVALHIVSREVMSLPIRFVANHAFG